MDGMHLKKSIFLYIPYSIFKVQEAICSNQIRTCGKDGLKTPVCMFSVGSVLLVLNQTKRRVWKLLKRDGETHGMLATIITVLTH